MKKARSNCFLAIFCMVFSFLWVQAGLCQEAPPLKVTDSAICLNVENLACVDPEEEVSSKVEKLYCFTRIVGAQENVEVTHIWYYGDTERYRIQLGVRSASFRTFSSKRIQSHEIGSWHVDILGPDDKVLKTIHFKVVE